MFYAQPVQSYQGENWNKKRETEKKKRKKKKSGHRKVRIPGCRCWWLYSDLLQALNGGKSFGVFVFSADGNLISVPVVPSYNDQAKEMLSKTTTKHSIIYLLFKVSHIPVIFNLSSPSLPHLNEKCCWKTKWWKHVVKAADVEKKNKF